MELTKEQIQKIENYLDKKRLDYIDVRHEVLDHIILDMEYLMTREKLSFNEASKIVTKKWNKQLENDSSWITGLTYTAPSIVIKKAKQSFKKWFFLMMILAFLPTFFIDKLKILDTYYDFSQWLGASLITFFMLPIGFWYYKMIKNNTKTTYLFLFEKQVLISSTFCLLYSVMFNFTSFSFGFYFLPVQIMLFCFGLNLYLQHLKIVKRHQFNQ